MRVTVLVLIVLTIPCVVFGNHGPGASGGGSSTMSGETLKKGKFEFSLREDYTNFEDFSEAAVARHAASGEHFDALKEAWGTSASLDYGITDDFEVGITAGYFYGNDFVGGHFHEDDGEVEVGAADPQGMTDLVLLGKYRVISGQPGNIALISGVVLPTGRNDVRLSNGERLEPTDQPGSGRWGIPVGIAYSRFLTSRITIDASALYTFRLEKDDFKVGDRLDLGVSLAYRLTESVKQFPQYSVFGEVNDIYLQKDEEDGGKEENSGGNALYLTPGFRVRFTENSSLTVAPSIPVWQDLNGDQGKVEFKAAVTFTMSF